jgi:hypothetical protein
MRGNQRQFESAVLAAVALAEAKSFSEGGCAPGTMKSSSYLVDGLTLSMTQPSELYLFSADGAPHVRLGNRPRKSRGDNLSAEISGALPGLSLMRRFQRH